MPKKWSTKTPTVIAEPSAHELGLVRFDFTDDYSVFHYSKMPDRIPDKGEALARIAAYTFDMLGGLGVPHHMVAFEPPRSLVVRLVRVLDPALGELKVGDCCRLVPLQVIFRNRVPRNASIRRRLAAGKVDLGALGLEALPPPETPLPTPIVEFTTKLEEIDRFVTRAEAQALACLSDIQLEQLEALTLRIGHAVSELAARRGLVCEDGKLEFAVDEAGGLMLVDTAGTPDENRLTLNNRDVSKQILRDHYLAQDLEKRVQDWARAGISRDHWPPPEPLPSALRDLAADLYRALCERWTDTKIWGAPQLERVVERIAESELRQWRTGSIGADS